MERYPTLMAASRTKLWILCGVIVALLGAGYRISQPNWHTVSEAEFKAALHPSLIDTEPADAAAGKRFERITKVSEELSNKIWSAAGTAKGLDFLKFETKSQLEIDQILREGKVENLSPSQSERSAGTIGVLDAVARRTAEAAKTAARQGRSEEATEAFLRSLRIVDRMFECANAGSASDYQTNAEKEVGLQIYAALPFLSEKQLATIAAELPPAPRTDQPLRRAMIVDLNRMLFPALVDPIAWARLQYPKEDPEKMIATVTEFRFLADSAPAVPTYDAIETAQGVNRVVVPKLENAIREFDQQDPSGHRYSDGLTLTFPPNYTAGKEGYARKLAEFRYRWETAHMQNAFGIRILKALDEAFSEKMFERSFTRRALREALRTRIAMHRYRVRFGKSAPSLSAVVETGFLPQLPIDLFGKGAMHYDPKRHLIWSIGKNLKDDGGAKTPMLAGVEADMLWRVP